MATPLPKPLRAPKDLAVNAPLKSSIAVVLAMVFSGLHAIAADPDAPGKAVAGRDAVWRSIFARPDASPGASVDPELAALGRDLFRDTRLSGKGRASCATCHDEARAFTDGRRTGQGPEGAVLARNVPALYDLAWATSFLWDGRAPTLEAQARFPILHPDELAGDFTAIVARLAADNAMAARFARAFPARPNVSEDTILAALAAYERTLVSPRTRFDAWVDGHDAALDATEQQGFSIFVGKGGCVACHGGWRFTDGALHDIGLEAEGLARAKTPSLRELSRTAPYMHDGSKATLLDVIEHYAGGLKLRPTLDSTINRNLFLTNDEKNALVAFLETLSSEPGLIKKQ